MPHATPQQLADMVLNPENYSDSQLLQIADEIEANPRDLTGRAKLIGHSYYVSQCGQWEKHFLWVINNLPEDPFLSRIGHLIMDELHPEFYAMVKSAWQEKIRSFPASTMIFTNAASCLEISDLNLASQYIRRAVEIDSENSEALRVQRQIMHLQSIESQSD